MSMTDWQIADLEKQLADLKKENERLKDACLDRNKVIEMQTKDKEELKAEIERLKKEKADEEADIATISKGLTWENFQNYKSRLETLAASHKELVEYLITLRKDAAEVGVLAFPAQFFEHIDPIITRAEQLIKK